VQVDFYHLTRDPATKLVPLLAQKTIDSDKRLLVLAAQDDLPVLSKALWNAGPSSFLAHAIAGAQDSEDAMQPILLASEIEATHDIQFAMLADGVWRQESLRFERVFFLFTEVEIDAARQCWRDLSAREDIIPRYWKQDGGRWVEGP